jgi:hypothetical protein
METQDCPHCANEHDRWISIDDPARDIGEIARELASWEHMAKHSIAARDRLRDELIEAFGRERHCGDELDAQPVAFRR